MKTMNLYLFKFVYIGKLIVVLPIIFMMACAQPHHEQPLKDQINQLHQRISQVTSARDQNEQDLQAAQQLLRDARNQLIQTQAQIDANQQRIDELDRQAAQSEQQRVQAEALAQQRLQAEAQAQQQQQDALQREQLAIQRRNQAQIDTQTANHRALVAELNTRTAHTQLQEALQQVAQSEQQRLAAEALAQQHLQAEALAQRQRQEALQQADQANKQRVKAEAQARKQQQEAQQRLQAASAESDQANLKRQEAESALTKIQKQLASKDEEIKANSQTLTQFQAELQTAQENASRTQTEADTLREELTKLTEKHGLTTSALQAAEQGTTELKSTLKQANSDLAIARDSHESSSSQLKSALAEIATLNYTLSQERQKFTAHESHAAQLNIELEALKLEHQSAHQTSTKEKEGLRAQLLNLSKQYEALEKELDELRTQNTSTAKSLEQNQLARTELQTKLDQTTEELQRTQGNYRTQAKRLTEAERINGEITTQRDHLKSQNEELISKLQENQEALELAQAQARSTEEQKKSLEVETAHLRTELEQATEKMKQRHQESETRIALLTEQLDSIQKELKTETATNDRLQTALAELSEQIREALSENSTLTADIRKLQLAKHILEEEEGWLKNINTKLATVKTSIEDQKTSLAQKIISYALEQKIEKDHKTQKSKYRTSNVQDLLAEIFLLYKYNRIQFCKDAFLEAKTGPNRSNSGIDTFIDTLIEACTERTYPEYSSQYIHSLEQLSRTSSHPSSPHETDAAAAAATHSEASSATAPFLRIDDLITELEDKHREQKNTIWGVSCVDLSRAPWIVSSPRYLDADRLELDSDHHSENFLDSWAGSISKAEHFVDVTTLSVPEGKFLERLKLAILELEKRAIEKDSEIIVRILFGTNSPWLVQTVDVDDLMQKLTQNLEPNPTTRQTRGKLRIIIGTYDASFQTAGIGGEKLMSWNHSKIVAVDGKIMFTGGHNLYATYTHSTNPVHDLSLLIPGSLAKVGHRFAQKLWDYTASKGSIAEFPARESRNFFLKKFTYTPIDSKTLNTELTAKLEEILERLSPEQDQREEASCAYQRDNLIIALGRLANVNGLEKANKDRKGNVSDTAIAKMIRDSKHSLFISQQAVLPLFFETGFNFRIVDEIAQAVLRGVNVYILTSSTDPEFVGKGAFGYSSGYDRSKTFQYFYDKMKDQKGHSPDGIVKQLFQHLFVLPTANAQHEVPNHAKVVIADGMVAYVGSHNLYDDSHAEFGVIVGSKAARELITDYFSPLWHASLKLDTNYSDAARYKQGDFVYVRRSEPIRRDPQAPDARTTAADSAPPDAAAAPHSTTEAESSSSFLDSFEMISPEGAEFNPSQNWTLGRIYGVETNKSGKKIYIVALDFKIEDRSSLKMKTVDASSLKLAPGGANHPWEEVPTIDLMAIHGTSMEESTLHSIVIDPS